MLAKLRIVMFGLLCACSACKQSQPPPAAESGAPTSAAKTAAAPMPDVGRIEMVSIRAEGRGKIAAEAVEEAIKSAILQVNGTTVDMSSESFRGALAIAVGHTDLELRSSGFAELVSQHSRGAITNFKVVDLVKSEAESLYVATIEASVAKFRTPEDSQRLKLVVAPVRILKTAYTVGNDSVPAVQVASQLHQRIIDELSQTGRFSVLDREFTEDIQNELSLVSSGQAPTAEFAKLGQALSADLIWVSQIESMGYERHARNLATSDRQLVSYSGGATLSHRLINVATRQIIFSDSVDVMLAPMGPTTLGLTVNAQDKLGELESGLASRVVPEIVMRMFPVTVVSRSGNSVVLSQGGKLLRERQRYQVVLMGDEMRDPQTGQSLGRIERPCCVVDIDRVAPTMSYGTLRDVAINLDATLPGGLQLRQAVPAPPTASIGTAGEVSSDATAVVLKKAQSEKTREKTEAPDKRQSADENW